MLDIQLLRKDIPTTWRSVSPPRRIAFDVARFRALEDERKALQTRTEELQAKRNALVEADRPCSRARARTRPPCMRRGGADRRRAQGQRDASSTALQARTATSSWRAIPNLPHAIGAGRASRPTTTSRCAAGARRAAFDFPVKDHVDVGAGARHARLRHRGQALRRRASPCMQRRAGAPAPRARAVHARRAHRASTATPRSTRPTWSTARAAAAPGSCPSSRTTCSDAELRQDGEGDELYLIPTAEVPGDQHRARHASWRAKHLPLKFVCHTPVLPLRGRLATARTRAA
ncbi:MAG: hypothetical protein MZW92_51820 [Comamonadaceae bacterium]|nr:hypothetical protein [Comamonadaceae bacterium]